MESDSSVKQKNFESGPESKKPSPQFLLLRQFFFLFWVYKYVKFIQDTIFFSFN